MPDLHLGKGWYLGWDWYSDRWGLGFIALGGPWGFHLYLDICQFQFRVERIKNGDPGHA